MTFFVQIPISSSFLRLRLLWRQGWAELNPAVAEAAAPLEERGGPGRAWGRWPPERRRRRTGKEHPRNALKDLKKL